MTYFINLTIFLAVNEFLFELCFGIVSQIAPLLEQSSMKSANDALILMKLIEFQFNFAHLSQLFEDIYGIWNLSLEEH